MIRRSQSKSERIVLVLQGGGALGAYQAGAYEALAEAGHTPDWIAGISIGAINAAIIAGNTEQNRIPRLRAFWERVSSGVQASPLIDGTQSRELFNYLSAAYISTVGVPGFFEPRFPPPMVMPAGSPAALSVYDPAPLKTTLRAAGRFRAARRRAGAAERRRGQHPQRQLRLLQFRGPALAA